MPKRISINIDMQILADIAMRTLSNKEIAAKYGVSPSYVSKIATGKKVLDMPLTKSVGAVEEDLIVNDDDIDAVIAMINQRNISTTDIDIEKFLRQQIAKAVIRIRIYTEFLNNYKGE